MGSHGRASRDSRQAGATDDSRTGQADGWLAEDGSDVLLAVHLQPGARRTALAGLHGDRLKIAVQAPPLAGRANEALVDWIAERLGVGRRQVSIQAGRHSRDKTLRVSGIGADAVRQCMRHK